MAHGPAKYIFINGETVPFSDAKIHVMSPAVRYGASVFEGIRAYWNEDENQLYVFKLREHLVRFQNSMKLMRFTETYEIGDLEKWVLDLIRKNDLKEDIHIRPQAHVEGEGGGVNTSEPIGISIIALPMGRFMKEDGMKAMVSSWRRIDDTVMPPRIKCAANYQNSRLALIEAVNHGYDSTIILTREGKVAEEARACVFVCRDGVPMTPPVTYGILESITRSTILGLFSSELNVQPLEREIDRTELYIADEAFFCGSGAEVTPIVSIDGYQLPIGELTQSIKKVYFEIARGMTEKYKEWRTPVY
jgi:branched-chain amino acid aminotransferase